MRKHPALLNSFGSLAIHYFLFTNLPFSPRRETVMPKMGRCRCGARGTLSFTMSVSRSRRRGNSVVESFESLALDGFAHDAIQAREPYRCLQA